jgi:hypothetical protein
MYDYVKDTMVVSGTSYDLKPYRKWLARNHESLVQKHFIKAIAVGFKTKFTYDWQHIYFVAEEYNFLKDYLNELHSNTTR